MGTKVTFDYSKAKSFVAENEVKYMSKIAADAKDLLVSKQGAGNAHPCNIGRIFSLTF